MTLKWLNLICLIVKMSQDKDEVFILYCRTQGGPELMLKDVCHIQLQLSQTSLNNWMNRRNSHGYAFAATFGHQKMEVVKNLGFTIF